MKQLVIKTIVLSLLAILILVFVLDPKFRESNANSKTFNGFQQKIESKEVIDILIVGSSHAKNTFSPLVIDSIFHTNTYNLGTGGQSYKITNHLLESALLKTKPKLIVVDLFPALMKLPSVEKSKASQLRVFDYTPISLEKIKLINSIYTFKEQPSVFSETIRNHDKWFDMNWSYKEFEINNPKFVYSNGFFNSNKVMNDDTKIKYQDFNERHEGFFNPDKPSKGELVKFKKMSEDLKETIEICKKHNVKLMFVSAPYFPSFYNKHLNKTHSFIKEYLKQENQMFIDFNEEFLTLGLRLDNFWNDGHLNLSGSSKVSTRLSQKLSDLNLFKVKDSTYFNNKLNTIVPRTKEELERIILSTHESLISDVINKGITIESDHNFNDSFQLETIYFYINNQFRYVLLETQDEFKTPFLENNYFLFAKTVNESDFSKRPKWQLGTDKNKLYWEASPKEIKINDKNYLLFTLEKKCEIVNFDNVRIIIKNKESKKNIGKELQLNNIKI